MKPMANYNTGQNLNRFTDPLDATSNSIMAWILVACILIGFMAGVGFSLVMGWLPV